jgi:ferric-dicitrate binding protein FerR (iron transport regulator)
MDNIEIENILAKKVTGEATSSELAYVEQWRKESVENQNLYNEYEILWDTTASYEPQNFMPDFEAALSSHLNLLTEESINTLETDKKIQENKIINLEPEVQKTRDKNITTQQPRTKLFSIKRLSSIAAIFVLGIAAMFLLKNNTTTISSESGVMFASLDDGSMLWLDEGSSISYDKGFGVDHRDLKMEGKVFFDVSRNEDLPFNISEDNLNVTVLGTSFTIDDENDSVIVTSGKVQVESNNEKVLLVKNQKVKLDNGHLNTSNSESNSSNWRNSDLSFDESPLTQVVADINMFYDNKLVLDNNSTVANCKFTSGGMSSQSLENIIEILKKTYDLEVSTLDNGTIVMTVTDCK